MKKLITMMACAVMLCACGGSNQSSSEPQNESRQMEPSTLKLKGPHANLFSVADPYVLSLVKVPEKGWQVRVKITFVKAKDIDESRYEPALHCCRNMAYLDDFDVELLDGQYSEDDFSTLLAKEVGEAEDITLQPFSFDEMSYSNAKELYDAIRRVEIYDMELEKLTKESAIKKAKESLFDDEDLQDLKDAAETAGKLLDAEKEILNSLF